MVYIIYGTQSPMIKSRVRKITNENLDQVDDINFVRFDANETPIQECVDDASYLPLGYDKKVVLIEGCYFLDKNNGKNKKEASQDYGPLLNFIKNKNDEIHLILTVETNEIDLKSDIVNAVKDFGKVFQIVEPNAVEWKQYVKKYCEDSLHVEIERDAVDELAARTSGNVALFQNEATKLSLYTNHIKYDDVCLMVTSPLDDNAFQIFNFLIMEQNGKALSLYRDLLVSNTEPVSLISLLAGQFRLLNEVLFLSKQGLTNDEIGKELNIKPIRVQILRKNAGLMSEKSIERALESLYDLEVEIKSGSVDRFYVFELFLINFKR